VAECRCKKCATACEHIPGLFTPEEATKAIEAGLTDRLMAVGCHDERGTYRGISPLSMPKDGVYEATAITPHLRLETAAAKGRCTFFTADNRCEIHATGFKPRECATALLCRTGDDRPASNAAIRDAWASLQGRRVVAVWERSLEFVNASGGK
jgi:Fe-S-cluster containining protein